MLVAYFDDSGTHDNAPVEVWGGFIGREVVWEDFEKAWSALLREYGISAFHMVDCEAGEREFEGWQRAKRDLAIAEFRRVILDRDLWGISCSVAKRDWNELVRGDDRRVVGEIDEFCADMCVYDALSFTTAGGTELETAVVFDDRPARAGAILDRLKPYLDSGRRYASKLVSVTFANMKSALPLQAADMLAYETYKLAQGWDGGPPPARPHFQRFLDNGLLIGGIATRDAIPKIIQISRETDRMIAALLQAQGLDPSAARSS